MCALSLTLLILSLGHAHAVTQAVVVNQKIQTESTERRDIGNISSLLTGL